MAAPSRTAPVGERMASLETAFAAHSEADRVAFAALTATLTEIREGMAEIKAQQSRQKGFIGGVIVVVSSLWAIVAMAIKFLPLKP